MASHSTHRDLNELNSDHNPVMLMIDDCLSAKIYRNFSIRATRWNLFQDYLKEIQVPTGSCSSTVEVDDALSSITETIKTAKKIAEVDIVPEQMQLKQ